MNQLNILLQAAASPSSVDMSSGGILIFVVCIIVVSIIIILYKKKSTRTYLTSQNEKYPALQLIILISKILAILNLIGSIIVAFKINDYDSLKVLPWSSHLLVIIIGIFTSLFIWASAEVLQLLIDIESNTRKTLK